MNNEFTSRKSQTDWERLDAMTDEDIDFSDCPEITPEMFAKAVVRRGLPNPKTKAQVTLHIDSDMLNQYIREDRRDQIYNNLKLTQVEHQKDELKFSSNINELRQLIEE